jgi:hypothetical protein
LANGLGREGLGFRGTDFLSGTAIEISSSSFVSSSFIDKDLPSFVSKENSIYKFCRKVITGFNAIWPSWPQAKLYSRPGRPGKNIAQNQMAFKFGKMVIHATIIGLLLAILVILVRGGGRTTSSYEPSPIVITPGPNVSADPNSIFDINPSLECVPGPSMKAAYYTSGLTPGGLCDSGDYVKDNMRDYAIADGVGGSLLEK